MSSEIRPCNLVLRLFLELVWSQIIPTPQLSPLQRRILREKLTLKLYQHSRLSFCFCFFRAFAFVLCSDKINAVSTVKIKNIYGSGINSPKWPCLNTFPSPTCSPSSLHPEKNCLKIGVSPPSTTRVTCVHWGYPFLLINSFNWQKGEKGLLQKYRHYDLRCLIRIPQSQETIKGTERPSPIYTLFQR